MNFYQQQVQTLSKNLYPHKYLLNQVINAKRFIDNSYANELTLNEIARAACMSKFHFVRLFKKYYGKTPYQYLTEVRMAKAKELLTAGHTVSETCYLLGFSSLSSFSILFKKMAGVAAIDYRTKSNIQ